MLGPALPAELVFGGSFSKDGSQIVFDASGSTAPHDIWVLDRTDDKLWQVTYSPHAGVDLHALVQPELVHFATHDGLELSGWLYRPHDVPVPIPMVLSFHGGPEG